VPSSCGEKVENQAETRKAKEAQDDKNRVTGFFEFGFVLLFRASAVRRLWLRPQVVL